MAVLGMFSGLADWRIPRWRPCLVAFLLLLPLLPGSQARAEPRAEPGAAISFYIGQMTAQDWQDSLRPEVVSFRRSSIAALTYSHRLGRWFDGLNLEL